VQQRCVSELRRGRVVLAGDAAHTSNPMGGLGLSGAVLEAEQLADALIAGVDEGTAIGALDQFAARRRNTFLEFTSSNASAYFTAMKESGPIQRTRDLAMLEKAGNDRSLMRRILLDFDKLNGQRSRSITAWGRRVTGSSRWFARRTVRATSKSALALVNVVKHRLAKARSL
jgi:3-(3-hydroxy-phenyl)propionate hydroxylase